MVSEPQRSSAFLFFSLPLEPTKPAHDQIGQTSVRRFVQFLSLRIVKKPHVEQMPDDRLGASPKAVREGADRPKAHLLRTRR